MFLAVAGLLTFTAYQSNAQEEAAAAPAATEEVASSSTEDAVAPAAPAADPFATTNDQPLHQQLKAKFIEGGAGFMATVLLCLILGLAIAIERIITLSLSQTNTDKLLAQVEEKVKANDIEGAKEVCRNTRGPVASIFYQGLLRMDQGIENVEKAVTSYGGVQAGYLERNCSWITLCIAMAPSLGFLGTVVGMVQAFDKIQQVGDISPTVVAGGMKVALITTLFGIIVALILQFFYNFVLSKIEAITSNMEDSSISLLDMITKAKLA